MGAGEGVPAYSLGQESEADLGDGGGARAVRISTPQARLSTSQDMPRMIDINGVLCPAAPQTLEQTGLEEFVLADLTCKLAATVPRLSSDWAAERLRLPVPLLEKIVWQLKDDHYIEILGTSGMMTYRYSTSERGMSHAHRLLEISGYVGPAPVTLEQYAAMLDWQFSQMPPVTFDDVRKAVGQLVLSPEAVEVTALAAASARSLFLFGPPGNGKTSIGRLVHNALHGEIWIPHCIAIDSHVIRIFDRQVHQVVPGYEDDPRIDQRWVRIRRPFVIAGGEMTIDELDLAYSPSLRFYEAPPHVKANGGTFLLDDFGRQQVSATDLLNRWIIPLEQQIDHLTLNTGQKIQIPFKLQLVVATNLKVSDVADPAFLRRMGYRLHLDKPEPARYAAIFERYAAAQGISVDPAIMADVLERYSRENRELRSSEPRDLIERARDICRLRGQSFALRPDIVDMAWTAYFGHTEALPTHVTHASAVKAPK
jgi:predicted ATPase with chaperone activity